MYSIESIDKHKIRIDEKQKKNVVVVTAAATTAKRTLKTKRVIHGEGDAKRPGRQIKTNDIHIILNEQLVNKIINFIYSK